MDKDAGRSLSIASSEELLERLIEVACFADFTGKDHCANLLNQKRDISSRAAQFSES